MSGSVVDLFHPYYLVKSQALFYLDSKGLKKYSLWLTNNSTPWEGSMDFGGRIAIDATVHFLGF